MLRFLGIRRRSQKVVAFGSVVVGFITRLIMGPIALLKVVSNGYADLTSETSSQVTFGITVSVLNEFMAWSKFNELFWKIRIRMDSQASRICYCWFSSI